MISEHRSEDIMVIFDILAKFVLPELMSEPAPTFHFIHCPLPLHPSSLYEGSNLTGTLHFELHRPYNN
jgi:hypothetical protein